MINPYQGFRILHINLVLLRHGLDEIALTTKLLWPIRFLKFLSPWYWQRHRNPTPWTTRIRRCLEELGPIFVKFGQLLSTRRDLLPPELADELALLQDKVPPFSGSQARIIIEQAYNCPIDNLLDDFDEKPLASASIAQVHTAKLKDGRPVIVKVLRPGVEKIIQRDISLLYVIAKLAHRYWPDGRRLRPLEVVRDYETTIFDELDLLREAANASELRRNWLNSPALYVPEVYWNLTRRNVLVMERIYGTPISNLNKIKAQGISMRLLGERGVEIFFTQVFRDNFFHADMHPGNIFVEPSGRYIAVDFGIMGSLSREDQRYLAENLLAFFQRDYRRVAELHLESGWVPANTRVNEFESAIRTVCEPIFDKPIKEISFGHFLVNLFHTARRFNMEVQPQLVLLEKTLLNIEGLGRELYPELDLWSTAKPFIERWLNQQVGPKAFFAQVKALAPKLAEQLPEFPPLLYRLVKNAEQGRLRLEWHSQQIEQLQANQKRHQRHLIAIISNGFLLIVSTLLYGFALVFTVPWLLDIAGISISIFTISLLWIWWQATIRN
ncbi:ubiquinone biosynthesis protein UbiB [Achromatium sp. WMS3]|nr:ubiquinone biosynthesis protein UbiB [Achromatium sp. WMS3]